MIIWGGVRVRGGGVEVGVWLVRMHIIISYPADPAYNETSFFVLYTSTSCFEVSAVKTSWAGSFFFFLSELATGTCRLSVAL